LTIEEVAQAMGKSNATVKRYLASARETLASHLGITAERSSDVETRQVVDAYRTS
jgi:DNA-directed RNA polymerase specialized sigma24 family protein